MIRRIELQNVRVNNLKEVCLDIPHGQLIAFCGLSGSGKSSLAFDTLYAEGQRRYIESLSPHTRQFINQLDKPEADRIDGIQPAIAVKAFRGKVGQKSTVGTATDVTEYIRLMVAKIGQAVCPDCKVCVASSDAESVARLLDELTDGTRYQIVFQPQSGETLATKLMEAKRNGFVRAVVGSSTVNLADTSSSQIADAAEDDEVRVVVDRLKSGASDASRVRESLEIAFQFGRGSCEVLIRDEGVSTNGIEIGGSSWTVSLFSKDLTCSRCRRQFPPAEPRLFSFSNKVGACKKCDGNGFLGKGVGAICELCHGSRLNEDALCFQVGGKNIFEMTNLKIEEARQFFEGLTLSASETEITKQILPEICARIRCLCEVGLPYLTLDRPLRTLSSGEGQRVSLTSCLSSTLVNMLYVLDEPSVGLHAHDVEGLVTTIRQLKERGNTVVIVDHEEKMIRAAERVVEIGPAAGASGGEIVFDGTATELMADEASLTGDFLAGRRGITCGADDRRSPRGKLRLTQASGNNLKNIDVEFPLGCLCVVAGVSGAGKSSLVQQTLYGAICQRKQKTCEAPLPFGDIFGDSQFDEVVLIDQSPIGRSPRSNPVTYVKAFDDIRRTFAETIDAKTRNIKVSQFSFNVSGGRCDKCDGDGQLSIDMQFMPDISIKCDQCRGTRYRDEVLAVRYRGKSIADALNLTVREAFSFFRGQPKVQAKLKSLIDVGLDYVRLGQPATTLSSGEAQRLKLGHYLNASKSKRALFILDEPTTGLHMADVMRLLECFEALLAVGHSLIIVEHNLQLMKYSDWIIDLGPGAAENGGRVVAQGPPETVAEVSGSITGHYLRKELAKAI
ncbi:MAG: excinuclease ABC subunit UvrA [Mariniblastus sp.]|nr:excinuclease ABC subunit UvrA [Mariniblastus sp.]